MSSQESMTSPRFQLPRRMRRMRASAPLRRLTQETFLDPQELIQPLFFHGGNGPSEAIASMPGMLRHHQESLMEECRQIADLGGLGVALFPSIDPALKDEIGSHATSSKNILLKAISNIRKALPDFIIIADVALDPYTNHGHDGVLNEEGNVDNDPTLLLLQELALREAEAGASMVAPSDMMDGRIGVIRSFLDEHGYEQIGILSYAAKYASAYYGPFREALGSTPSTFVTSEQKEPMAITPRGSLDKRGYQMNPANWREALIEAQLDEEEGADILMVKPAGPYLDIIRLLRENTHFPIAAYQVSGEYAQIHAAAQLGWLDYEATRDESLLAIKRAGASMILSYFAKEMLTKWAKS